MYCAYVTTLKGLRKHSNADRLQCVEVFGQNVIVDLSYKDGQKVVFFPSDGQLSEEYAKDNNLVRMKDENGNNIGGYMDARKRSVTAIRLRGEKSEGLVLPIESLSKYVDVAKLKDGDQITVIGVMKSVESIFQKVIEDVTIQEKIVIRRKKIIRFLIHSLKNTKILHSLRIICLSLSQEILFILPVNFTARQLVP